MFFKRFVTGTLTPCFRQIVSQRYTIKGDFKTSWIHQTVYLSTMTLTQEASTADSKSSKTQNAKLHGHEFYRSIGSPKTVVAPMVDQSELAWRLISRQPIPPASYRTPHPDTQLSATSLAFLASLDSTPELRTTDAETGRPLGGADLCYTPMIHSKLFVESAEHAKAKLKEDFFNTEEGEEGSKRNVAGLDVGDRPLFVQFCANDPDTLLKAAKLVENHCDAVDINFGCPQGIAKKGRYGSFLQDEWDLIHSLINTLHRNLSIPVTAKFRVFPDVKRTVEYAQMMERAGASILTCHGRTREMKGQLTGLADWQQIKAVKEAVSVPVFANGNILYQDDVEECLRVTGCDGIMSAEGNLSNAPVFVPPASPLSHYPCDIMAAYYLDIVDRLKTPTAGSAVKAHMFRILRKSLDRHLDLRNKLGGMNRFDIKWYRQFVSAVSQRIEQEMKDEAITTWPIARDAHSNVRSIPSWAAQPYVRAQLKGLETEGQEPAMKDAINGTTGEDRVIEAGEVAIQCKIDGCNNLSAGTCSRGACLIHCRSEGAVESKMIEDFAGAIKLTMAGKTVGQGCEGHEAKVRAREQRRIEMRASQAEYREQRKRELLEKRANDKQAKRQKVGAR